MDHPAAVGEVQRLRQRADDQPDLLQRQPPPPPQQVAQGLARQVLEDGERLVVVEPVVVDRGDRRVGQVGPEPGLLGERGVQRGQSDLVQDLSPARRRLTLIATGRSSRRSRPR